MIPQRGDEYLWTMPGTSPDWPGIHQVVQRVAKDGTWADVWCIDLLTGAEWKKRQPLPMPGMPLGAALTSDVVTYANED